MNAKHAATSIRSPVTTTKATSAPLNAGVAMNPMTATYGIRRNKPGPMFSPTSPVTDKRTVNLESDLLCVVVCFILPCLIGALVCTILLVP